MDYGWGMPVYENGEVKINYEVVGDGPPVILIAPGGLDSKISKWEMSPWPPIESLKSGYTVIAMDQRNAGRSFAPVEAGDGWNSHLGDQLGLLDNLGIERCHFLGMCIGGPYIANVMKHAPDRVSSAVLLQPVGVDDGNRSDFWAMSDRFGESLRATTHPELSPEVWDSYVQHMWGGEFLLTATPEDVKSMQTPMLILMGDDNYHPAWTSRQMATLAPNAELVEQWKDPSLVPEIHSRIRAFLAAHT